MTLASFSAGLGFFTGKVFPPRRILNIAYDLFERLAKAFGRRMHVAVDEETGEQSQSDIKDEVKLRSDDRG